MGLTGSIPSDLSRLTGLTHLRLGNNQLSGSIPSSLGDLSRLQELSLSQNRLRGAIPPELGNLGQTDVVNVLALHLNDNQLSGTIPSELGDIGRLAQLYLNNNRLTGTIPPELGDLTVMAELDLSHNQLEGSIPTELGGLGRGRNADNTYNNVYSLTYLDLGHNQMSGNVPSGLGLHTELTHLDLSSNQLSGNVETNVANNWGSLLELTHLYLDQNQFTGFVPGALGNGLYGLKELTLHGNDFTRLAFRDNYPFYTPYLIGLTGMEYLTLDAYLIPEGGFETVNEFGDVIYYPQDPGLEMSISHGSQATKRIHLELPEDSTPDYADADRTYLVWRYDPEAEYHASASAATLPVGATLASEPVYFELALHFLDDAGTPIVGGRLPEPAVVCLEHDRGLENPQLFGLAAGSSMWRQLPTGNPGGYPTAVYTACGETRDLSTFVVGTSTSEVVEAEAGVVKREVSSDGEVFRAVVDDQSIALFVPPGAVEPGQSVEFTINKAEDASPRGFIVSGSSGAIEINLPDGVELAIPVTVCMEPEDDLSGEQYLLHLGDEADSWVLLFKPLSNPPGYEDWICGHTSDFSSFTIGVIDPAAVGHVARISRIEPSIRSVTVSPGDAVRLTFSIFGRQDNLDNSLGEAHDFEWSDGGAGGIFRATQRPREVFYTAPESYGIHAVTMTSPSGVCLSGDDADEVEDRCTAKFTIIVRPPSAALRERPVPENPIGKIPSVLVDTEGRQYEVLTPEDGGSFIGDAVTISAEPGVVPNREIVGVRADVGDAASNIGQVHHRYSLAGMWHEVRALDADESPVSGYVLQSPLEVCLPLPDMVRSNISDVVLVPANEDDSLTILASSVRITTSGTQVCGGLSELPASVAVGRLGSPADLPAPTPELGEIGLPDTGGGFAPSGSVLVFVLLMVLGIGVLLVVLGRRFARSRGG